MLNEEHSIEATLAAMSRQRFSGSLEFLIVDGGSTDRSVEIVAEAARRDPRIRLLRNPRGGTPSGLNVGLAHARGRWVARMDAHTDYPEDYLARGVARLAAGGTRWVSGLQRARGTNRVSRAVALALRGPLGRGASRKWVDMGSGEEYELDSGVFGGVWERATLIDYGGWDEEWLRNQDSEMAGRFLAAGEALILVPQMGAWYVPRGSLRGLWRQYFQYGEYRIKTAGRHPATLRRSHLLAPGVVAAGVVALGPPRMPLRRLARWALVTYGAAVAGAAERALRTADDPRDAASVVPVLIAMHLGHGAGAYVGAARHGIPWAAVTNLLRLRGLTDALSPPPGEVFAPSLWAVLRPDDAA